jgi:hypothetical protein
MVRPTNELQNSNCTVCRYISEIHTVSERYSIHGYLWFQFTRHSRPWGSYVELKLKVEQHEGITLIEEPGLLVFDSQPGTMIKTMREVYEKAADFRTMKDWVYDCEHQHGLDCNPGNTEYIKNLNVIDCKRFTVIPAPPNCKFVALSYVWGPATIPVPLKDAPATIKDSITVTLTLGYQYIWIDRYVRITNSSAS